ncbi:MAG: DUF4097 family beta strand repeat-containing protein [Candidatus Aminicenantes bacterium]|jgi:DUF4097 and DUF4098 domain-containing protein YvlB
MKLKRTMTSLGVVISLILMLGVSPTDAEAKEKYEEKFEKTLSIVRDGKVIVGNVSGDIKVETWNKAQVQIDALKISRAATTARAKENVEQVNITISEENSTVRIKTEYPKGPNKGLNVSVDYMLKIPVEAAINANTISGDVTCSGIGGALKASSKSGDIIVAGAKDGAVCSTISGDVEVENIDGDVDLHTVSGDVLADSVKGSVEADTVSGSVVLTNITMADQVEASTTSGSVKYEGAISSDGYYSLKAHSGRVEFIVPADAAFDVEAKTFSGSINSEFEMTVIGKIDKKSISGSINGGGAEVELKTFSGSVYIKKR